jgi:DNA polymerase III subunit delta'
MSKSYIEQLISNNLLTHAYFLQGATESIAIWMASRILCCGTNDDCITCSRIYNENHPDVMIVRPSGLAITVNQIRELRERAAFKSFDGKGQVFIISQADTLNQQASNAFLTFLEEPKKDCYFILTGKSKDRLLETVKSRIQVIPFTQQTSFLKELVERDVKGENLGIYEQLNLSVDEYVAVSEQADKWIVEIKRVLSSNRLLALQQVQTWDTLFADKQQRLICIKLIQSYVKALFAVKKGTYQTWGQLPVYDWNQLVIWSGAIDNLSRAFHSNGQFLLHIENFIRTTISSNLELVVN